ncbi:helix-turn-helix domain-containing protein [Streptomyces sp. LRE541]|uniref:helix-turn-helix domain-containing protein n=1 Tax=Streptomyces sp. LRE541 TaxID=2931983 RepID=UPI00200BF057|nr:helix-turn-helix domain-containing protein [Streptomyces sp. LRE541]UPZ27735.1 helix-turn-helix domain-containing protein [Streptomyces sp. LRE541]
MESERDWERLGNAYAEARKLADLTQVEVAERLGVSRTPIQAIERGKQSNGRPFTKVSSTMRAYARLVGWAEGSPEQILSGGDPDYTPQEALSQPSEPSGLPSAVDRELRSGKTLDHAVVHLGGADDEDDFRLVVVVKGAEGMTEEEIDRRFEQWRRMRRTIQALPGGPDAPQDS